MCRQVVGEGRRIDEGVVFELLAGRVKKLIHKGCEARGTNSGKLLSWLDLKRGQSRVTKFERIVKEIRT